MHIHTSVSPAIRVDINKIYFNIIESFLDDAEEKKKGGRYTEIVFQKCDLMSVMGSDRTRRDSVFSHYAAALIRVGVGGGFFFIFQCCF